MTFLDWIEWLTATTEKDKRLIWQRSHPAKLLIAYTNCPDIKRYWASPLGRLYLDCYMFWSGLKRSTSNMDRTADRLRWQISWAWRSRWREFTNHYIGQGYHEEPRSEVSQTLSGDLSGYIISASGKLLAEQWRSHNGDQDLYNLLTDIDLCNRSTEVIEAEFIQSDIRLATTK